MTRHADVVIVGGGAAGLATGIFAARLTPDRSIVVLDGARKIGAKILVSGGGRCNITNVVVTTKDFSGGNHNVIRRVLASLPVAKTVAFFREIGVEMYEEDYGKLFPTTDKARTVLDALMNEAKRVGVRILSMHRVTAIRRHPDVFEISCDAGTISSRNVVLATGGQSLPKTGSDGSGYQLAEALGHTLVPTSPALVALQLEGGFHTPLSGISHQVELTLASTGCKPIRASGVLLWTHFGISGPVTLDISRHWHRARIEGRPAALFANLLGLRDAADVEKELVDAGTSQARVQLANVLAQRLPARLVDAILSELGIDGGTPMAHLTKDARRRVVNALVRWALPVRDSRGYTHAEATAGGVPFTEVDARSLGSRKCPGLYFTGEILDVDGRIGGFNFQWAWSSAWVVANALARQPKPGNTADTGSP